MSDHVRVAQTVWLMTAIPNCGKEHAEAILDALDGLRSATPGALEYTIQLCVATLRDRCEPELGDLS